MNDAETRELVERLRERYTDTPVPSCRVCGGELSIQAMGGSRATEYAHSRPEGVPFNDWYSHYVASHWTQFRSGDSDVHALLDLVEPMLSAPAGQCGNTQIIRCWSYCSLPFGHEGDCKGTISTGVIDHE